MIDRTGKDGVELKKKEKPRHWYGMCHSMGVPKGGYEGGEGRQKIGDISFWFIQNTQQPQWGPRVVAMWDGPG